MQEQNNETKAKKDIKVFLKDYKLVIIGLLLCILVYLSFTLGSMYACNGMIYKGVCVQPQLIGTLEICETDPFTCNRNCGTALINDFSTFCEQWGYKSLEYNDQSDLQHITPTATVGMTEDSVREDTYIKQ